jgi:hypothetical protein
MALVKFFKETSLPGTLEANSFYLIPHANGTTVETYLTNSSGTARQVNGESMIELFAGPLIIAQLAQMNRVEIVANITARNTLIGSNFNQLVLVSDATGDATVTSGAALYFFKNADNSWIKVAEYESMDATITWSTIVGKPSSAPTLIDDAVSKRHDHSNKAILDKWGESGGAPTYNGLPIGGTTQWDAVNW